MNSLLFKQLSNKKVLLLGFGREGQSSYRYIRRVMPELMLTIADRDEMVAEHILLKGDKNLDLRLGEGYLDDLSGFDRIIKTPGIPLKWIPEAQRSAVTSQTDLFLRKFWSQVVGVTGTKGKTTTSTLIHHIQQECGLSILMGNIGRPAFDVIDEIKPSSIIIFELSSHQLEFIHRAPHISVILNLYEEHLDAYTSFEAYQRAKLNIAMYQTAGDHLIYNADDERIAGHIEVMDSPAYLWPYSIEKSLNRGCFIKDGKILMAAGDKPHVLFDLRHKIKIKGDHNLRNIMAAATACYISGFEETLIEEGIGSFRGLEHRLEYAGTYKGIRFYNDSIATIPEACMEAVKALGEVDTLILGGFDRGIDYSGLARFLAGSEVRNLIFTGEAGRRIMHEIKGIKNPNQVFYSLSKFEDFPEIVFNATKPGTICLLSPAAASYDEFQNFEVRGRKFKDLVRLFR